MSVMNILYVKHALYTCILVLATTSCSYDISINERVVYTPAPHLIVKDISDNALRNCLQQHIEDASITKLEQLQTLVCSSAGIRSLAGIERYRYIVRLNLKKNALSDLLPLASLRALQELNLDNNNIVSAKPLGLLDTLTKLSLIGNKTLHCGSTAALRQIIPTTTLALPKHCNNAK